MKKRYITLIGLFMLTANELYSQVGINTESPKVTLDVKKNTAEAAEGIIAPWLTVQDIIDRHSVGLYGADQNGAIVYVTNELGYESDVHTKKIDKVGYYYYSSINNMWLPFGGASTNGSIWYTTGTTTPSTSNNDNSYLKGKVVTGADQPADVNGGTKNAQLTVVGQDAVINGITVGSGLTAIPTGPVFNTYPTNAALGFHALKANTGGENTAVGFWSLAANTTGVYNTAVGARNMFINETGKENVGLGAYTLVALKGGDGNTAVGYNVLPNLIGGASLKGNDNTGVGAGALGLLKAGDNNVGIGKGALYSTVSDGNVGVGKEALAAATTGSYNVAIGYKANSAQTTANNTIAVGNEFTEAINDYTIAIGDGTSTAKTIAYGVNAIAVGKTALAGGVNTMAMGTGAKVTGEAGMAMGPATAATGSAIAIGNGVSANATHSITIGHRTVWGANNNAQNNYENTTFLKNNSTIVGNNISDAYNPVSGVTLQLVPDVTKVDSPEGLLIPRMSRKQLIDKTATYVGNNNAQHGALVFVLAYPLDGTVTAKEADISTGGFYYFDAYTENGDPAPNNLGKWVKIARITDIPKASLRQNSVTVGGVGADYSKLQTAYDAEAKKTYNQIYNTPVTFICSGDVGLLTTDGSIPYIVLTTTAATNVASFELHNTRISLKGEFTTGKMELYNTDLTYYRAAGDPALVLTVTNGITVDRSSFDVLTAGATITAAGMTAQGGYIDLTGAATTLTGSGVYMLGSTMGGFIRLANGSLTFTGGGSATKYSVYASDNGSFTSSANLTFNATCDYNLYSTTNSHIQLFAGMISGSNVPVNYMVAENNSRFTISGSNNIYMPSSYAQKSTGSAIRSTQGSLFTIDGSSNSTIEFTSCNRGLDADGGVIRVVGRTTNGQKLISFGSVATNPLRALNGGQVYTLGQVGYTGTNIPATSGAISPDGSVIYDPVSTP